jgi:hypothetical protein
MFRRQFGQNVTVYSVSLFMNVDIVIDGLFQSYVDLQQYLRFHQPINRRRLLGSIADLALRYPLEDWCPQPEPEHHASCVNSLGVGVGAGGSIPWHRKSALT